jgi:phage major head subunit gpT-like protein
MIINQENLANIYVGLSTAFNAAFQAAPDLWFRQVAMVVPSTGASMDYKFILDFPGMREWIGDRVIKSLAGKNWVVENQDWEATVEVLRKHIEDDQIGLYAPIVSALAEEAAHHPNQLIAALIADNPLCFDGQNFFDTDHPVGTGTAGNYDAGASTAWYLLDTRGALKPFIFQSRRGVELTRMDRPDDENVFMRNAFRYGVDARYAVAVGLWQKAYKSTQTLNGTYYGAARAAMMAYENEEGRKLGVKPSLLVVPPSLEGSARELLNNQFIIGDPTAGGSKENVWRGTADLLVVPELA